MLALPTVGIAHRDLELDVLCDWIEGSLLFQVERLSPSDIVDILLEEQVYDRQEGAWVLVSSAWAELQRRLQWLDAASPIRVVPRHMIRLRDWQDAPAHSFCLALSYAKWYPGWARQFGKDYTEQGELFEALSREAMEKLFPGWVVKATGWTRTHASKLNEVVQQVVDHLGEMPGEVRHWTTASANEAGLDLFCYRPFVDGRVGWPVFLMQCASGGNWSSKLHTPELRIWGKIVQFASDPKKAFAMPYALSDEHFARYCNLVNGLFLDRYRLLSAGCGNPKWVSGELKERIVTWLRPRLETLPRSDD
jgi:hypothetical protein